MSDKNRNMNGINDQKTAEQQAFSEEIRRRLAEPGSGKPTLDEFKVMVYKDREKRRKKRNALVACIVAAFIVGYLTYDDLVPEVGADKNPKETIVTEDGVIIEDGGYGSSEEEDNVFIIDNWRYIEDSRKVVPGILIPENIPKEYVFKKLIIERLAESSFLCRYTFANNSDDKIEIEEVIVQDGETVFRINDIDRTIDSAKGKIYLQDTENKATIYLEGGITISIWTDLSDNIVKDIIESLV